MSNCYNGYMVNNNNINPSMQDVEVWGEVEDPSSTPGLEFSWAASDLYNILLTTLNIDTRSMVRCTIQRHNMDGDNVFLDQSKSVKKNYSGKSFLFRLFGLQIIGPRFFRYRKDPWDSTPLRFFSNLVGRILYMHISKH